MSLVLSEIESLEGFIFKAVVLKLRVKSF